MKLYFVENQSEGDTPAQIEAMRPYTSSLKGADAIYLASIVKMNQAIHAFEMTRKPLVVYCWDYYLWAHGRQNHSGDWNAYARLLRQAKLILVPSKAQQLRLKELLGLDSHIVLSGVTSYEHEVKDENFILDPLRYYPTPESEWAVKAADKLGIPIVHSEHQFSLEEFRRLVASCTFLTSTVSEASTGSLTLLEGLYHGKPSLVSDSPYMGAKDYLKDFGTYFKYDSFDDLVTKMNHMWTNRSVFNQEATDYVKRELNYDIMSKNIYNLCQKYT